jgi:uncharacterized RmlC-like cupin family protein
MQDITTCRVIRPLATVEGKQGLAYDVGISESSVGAKGLHLQRVFIPPLGKAKAHKHVAHETAILALEGRSGCFYGDALEHHAVVEQGDFFYIPAGVAHLPYNPSAQDGFVAVIARTDPNEQESVTMLPALDDLPHIRGLG